MKTLTSTTLLSSGVLAALASTASADAFDCNLEKVCSAQQECTTTNSSIEIFDRSEGYTRMVLPGGSLVDMERIGSGEKSRRDWLINGVLNGYAGLVTIHENGTLVFSEHSESGDGIAVTAHMHGKCERAN